MITLFRRLRQKFIGEGNTGRYILYAIGEILLVVTGILIALQVNNWNEERRERSTELLYLQSFKEDLDQNMAELDRVIEKTSRVAVYNDSLLTFLVSAESASLDQELFLRLLGESAGYTIFQSKEGTIQSIIGSGALEVIRDPFIRMKIAVWEGDLKNIRAWESDSKRSFDEYTGYLKMNLPRHLMLFDESVIDDNVLTKLQSDTFFLNTLMERSFISSSLNDLYKEKREELGMLSELVDREIQSLMD
ncbi:DUF6090 family protein [Rhodohalobacter mucosus]|uniref:Uncharacterized protein n=1 Tax=Rhodohalobacter mucosus TaxID=2079485 RepID=A0A316TRS6_9BACT|nr:DUF6090 family protein [Rhodohalobacter mucosus]PWN07297.1 hypothetical protein DDZ15_03245 [Rhodohalobacter mucosus]